MSDLSFKTQVRGKWVLAGEHSVLRGGTAVALPHPELSLELVFTPSREGRLVVEPTSADRVIQDILLSIQEDQQSKDQVYNVPSGSLEIKSTIPMGAGLGSSAALCVAMGRWLAESLHLRTNEDLQEFATRLEHRFHGRSSGMDVAVIASGEPISFKMPKGDSGITKLGIKRLPRFTFHDTGLRARTSDCVLKVERFREEDPLLAMRVDEQMGAASRKALEGLITYDASPNSKALEVIAAGMRLAQECFYSWQLIPGEAKRLEEDLMARGALAAKITGAGGGGMLVALWDK